jgi:hypothetical protein
LGEFWQHRQEKYFDWRRIFTTKAEQSESRIDFRAFLTLDWLISGPELEVRGQKRGCPPCIESIRALK